MKVDQVGVFESAAHAKFKHSLENQIFNFGSSDDILKAWKTREEDRIQELSKQSFLPFLHRKAIIGKMWFLRTELGLEVDDWYAFVAMLDAFCQGHEGCFESLPAISMAIVWLIKKQDSARLCDPLDLAGVSSKLATCLGLRIAATKEEIVVNEMIVLDVLGWELGMPTVQSWASMFVTRFNCLLSSQYNVQLKQMWDKYLAYVLLYHVSNTQASPQLPPYRLACAFFTIGLVWAGLLPLERLCQVGSDEYKDLLFGLLHGMGHIVISGDHDNILVSLQCATRCDIGALQEYCGLLSSHFRTISMEKAVTSI